MSFDEGSGVPRFANYLQDHMVLQRAPQRAIVWGFGDPRVSTVLTIKNQVYRTMSTLELANEQNESIWSVTLDAVFEEGPFDIHVSQPLTNGTLMNITLHDVLFGDVWLCSGQSNMEMTVGMIFNATEEINNAGHFPKIRLFTAATNESTMPIEELLGIELGWSVASPESVGGAAWRYMSAVCWLYGRMIHVALNSRPIGLIASSYAGTAIEFWTPPKVLQACNTTMTRNEHIPVNYPSNHSNLFNSMIYPFTRMVIYGSIWYQGEANAGSFTYACVFSKMIESWRQTWNERTNKNTNLHFPFGFVQVTLLFNG